MHYHTEVQPRSSESTKFKILKFRALSGGLRKLPLIARAITPRDHVYISNQRDRAGVDTAGAAGIK